MLEWFRNKLIGLMLALSWTENSLKGKSEDIRVGEGKFQSHKQGMLSDALVRGEVTQEVKELRWRLYKVMRHSSNLTSTITGVDSEGNPIVSTTKKLTPKNKLKRYKCDKTDENYPLVMVVPNKSVDLSTVDAVGAVDDAGVISRDNYLAQFKNKKTLFINRSHIPTFKFEDYVSKMLVREMPDDKYLLEFYISKYPTEDRKSRFAISEMKKIIAGRYRTPNIEFENLFFISEKVLGVDDFLEFDFKRDKFHSIVEYEGDYVLKIICDKVVYGDDVFEKYRMSDLDEKYDKKMKK
jgi:hypothetical protein